MCPKFSISALALSVSQIWLEDLNFAQIFITKTHDQHCSSSKILPVYHLRTQYTIHRLKKHSKPLAIFTLDYNRTINTNNIKSKECCKRFIKNIFRYDCSNKTFELIAKNKMCFWRWENEFETKWEKWRLIGNLLAMCRKITPAWIKAGNLLIKHKAKQKAVLPVFCLKNAND